MSIKLTPQIRTYASGVASIGERMKSTSDKFGIAAGMYVKNIDDIRAKKEEYTRLLNEFKSQEQTLLGLKAPTLLKTNHEELLKSFNKYVVATERAIGSLDVENVKTDEALLSEAQDFQWKASGEIVQISNEMARKLGI